MLIENEEAVLEFERDVLTGAVHSSRPLLADLTTQAGQELMNIWDDMDRGAIKQEEAFDQADQAVRRRSGAMEKEL